MKMLDIILLIGLLIVSGSIGVHIGMNLTKKPEMRLIPNTPTYHPLRYQTDKVKEIFVEMMKGDVDDSYDYGKMYKATVIFEYGENKPFINYLAQGLEEDMVVKFKEVVPGFDGKKYIWYEVDNENCHKTNTVDIYRDEKK